MRSTTTTIVAILSFLLAGAGVALADVGPGTAADASPPSTARKSGPAPATPHLILSQNNYDTQIVKDRAQFSSQMIATCQAHCNVLEEECIKSKKPKTKRSASEAFFQCRPAVAECFASCDRIK